MWDAAPESKPLRWRGTPATIVALDNYMPFLGQLRYHAEAKKVADRIDIVCASMFNMNFKPESFDAIWSEGAIYIAGFKNGLRDWQRFLKRGGYMALTTSPGLTAIPMNYGGFGRRAIPKSRLCGKTAPPSPNAATG